MGTTISSADIRAGTFKIVHNNESTTQTTFTQDVTNAGFLISTEYVANAYTPGYFWLTSNDSNTKPKAGIYLKETSSGTCMYLGTSNSYTTGITSNVVVDPGGQLGILNTSPGASIHVGSSTYTSNVSLRLESQGCTFIDLVADTDNGTTESHSPYINFSQDAAAVKGIIGMTGGAGKSPDNGSYTNALDNGMIVGTTTAHSLQLGVNGAAYLTILSTGLIGINTNNPTVALEVNGSIKASSGISQNGTTFTIGTGATAGDHVIALKSASTEGRIIWKEAGDYFEFKDQSGNYEDIKCLALETTGNITAKNIKTTTLTFAKGTTTLKQTWTHNYGATTYVVSALSDSFERHYKFSTQAANTIDIEIDDTPIDADIKIMLTLIGS